MTKWTFATIAIITAALAALIVWLRYDFSPTIAAVALLALFGVVVFAAGSLMSLASQRATLSAIGDFQRNDDRGEVERLRMMRQVLGIDAKAAPKSQSHDDPWRDVTPLLAAPQTWTPAQLPAQTGGDVVYYDGN